MKPFEEILDPEVHAYKAAYSKFMLNESLLIQKGFETNLDPSFEATRYALSAVAQYRKSKET